MLAGIAVTIQFVDRKWQDKQMLLAGLDHERGQLLEATGYCLRHEIYYTGRHTQTKLGYPKGRGQGGKPCLVWAVCLRSLSYQVMWGCGHEEDSNGAGQLCAAGPLCWRCNRLPLSSRPGSHTPVASEIKSTNKYLKTSRSAEMVSQPPSPPMQKRERERGKRGGPRGGRGPVRL